MASVWARSTCWSSGAPGVAVTGRNGAGKTTLVETVLGRAPLVSGKRSLGPSVVPGELAQHRTGLVSPDGTYAGPAEQLLPAFPRLSGLELAEARSLLAKFGLGAEHVERPLADAVARRTHPGAAGVFSGCWRQLPGLDEPTNHLDLPAIEQLEMALDVYDGTLLMVSHDRQLLEVLRVTHQAEVEDGRVTVAAR